MANNELENFSIELDTVLNRLMYLLQLDDITKLYSLLNISKELHTIWKHKKTMPYKRIIELALKKNLDLNYIFTGIKGGRYYGLIKNS